jgi:23S rRNA (guanosine2251-2'-O)-methyltransferase
MSHIIVIAHNIRSIHNIGSLFRTCEGFGVNEIICSGYTPHPTYAGDDRLPHIARAQTQKISKTALGAEFMVPFRYCSLPPLSQLKEDGFTVVGLEQDERAVALAGYTAPAKIALLIGEEVHGISNEFRDQCDILLQIPMYGSKESFNVTVSTAIALYELVVK